MALSFPFRRGVWHTFAAFSSFEDTLIIERRRDAALDLALGVGREPWMRLRNNELYPVFYFARHLGIEQDASFKLSAEGADIDVKLGHRGEVRHLQVTTAGPLWPSEKNWGRDYVLHMEKLKTEGSVR